VDHAVETRIAKHPDPSASHSQSREAIGIFLRDGCRCGYRSISGLQQPSSGPAKPATPRTYRRRDNGDFHCGRSRSGREFGPDVELGEDEEIGLEPAEQTIYVQRKVVG
jgi:hypothetical protein